MERYAIISYVTSTQLDYDSSATRGVGMIAGKLMEALEPAFKKKNIADLGLLTRRADILSSLQYAAQNLDDNGLCLFYFHGHGDSLPGEGVNDERKDQALVCHDDYLLDDDIDLALRAFKPTQRVFSIVDSCSSETVIEWSQFPAQQYPQIIHLASARDEEEALAGFRGGKFSSKFFLKINDGAYRRFTYKALSTQLEVTSLTPKCYVQISPNTSQYYLNKKLFD